jgi:NAD(P)-dependent dehydrogenase (short-subunit alcohol dehydrogenase family)
MSLPSPPPIPDPPARPWALITGCSTGIGRALVASCRAAGWGVVATARDLEALAGLPPGPDLRRLELDVTHPDTLATAVEACRGLRLTALINNAGYGQMGPLEFLPAQELRAQLETNVVGLHAVTQALLPLIRANARPGEGRIVHVASVLGRMSVPCAGAYCASKHAVVALGETLRLELAPGIRVILVEPGAVRSEFRETLAQSMAGLQARLRGTRFEPIVAAYLARSAAHGQRHGLGADACARRITAAMARKRPPRRVVIGRDAFWSGVAKTVLPAAWWEWAVRRAFGLGK